MALLQKRICSDGTLTGKNLLPVREQILSCKTTIPGPVHKLWPVECRLSNSICSFPVHSIAGIKQGFQQIFHSFSTNGGALVAQWVKRWPTDLAAPLEVKSSQL